MGPTAHVGVQPLDLHDTHTATLKVVRQPPRPHLHHTHQSVRPRPHKSHTHHLHLCAARGTPAGRHGEPLSDEVVTNLLHLGHLFPAHGGSGQLNEATVANTNSKVPRQQNKIASELMDSDKAITMMSS